MVEKIDRVDSSLYRVREAPEDKNRRQKQHQEEEKEKKEKDQFDSSKASWKKLLADDSSAALGTSAKLQSGEALKKQLQHSEEGLEEKNPVTEDIEEEDSLTLQQRFLVLWGILDTAGKPRIKVIVAYALVGSVITFALFLLTRILWP